jgi:hypothetical protein
MATRRYSRALLVTGAAAGAAFLQLRPGANPFRLRELTIAINAAGAVSSFGLARTATAGTSSGSAALQPEDGLSPAATTILSTGWSAAPTLPGTPLWLRRAVIAAAATTLIRWEWDQPGGLTLRAGSTIVLWNFGAVTSSDSEIMVAGEEEY